MKMNGVVVSTLALTLGSFVAPAISAQPLATPTGTFLQEGPWDQPPSEFRDVQRQGFHDGVEGARKDFDNHRPPNPENRDEFRHPKVERSLRDDYRQGFRQGYQRAMQHLMGDRDRH